MQCDVQSGCRRASTCQMHLISKPAASNPFCRPGVSYCSEQLSRHSAAHSDGLTSCSTLLLAPAGAQLPLLQDVSLYLPANQLGLIFGRSGAGKTTLLQLIAGLAEPTTGAISVTEPAAGTAAGNGAAPALGAKGSKFAQLKAAEAAKRRGGAGTQPPSVNGAAARSSAESGEQACSRWMHHCIIERAGELTGA